MFAQQDMCILILNDQPLKNNFKFKMFLLYWIFAIVSTLFAIYIVWSN